MAQPTFSKDYQAALARNKVASPVAASAASFKPTIPTGAAGGGNQDFLSWAMDIASRPMRTIANVPNQFFNEMNKISTAAKAGTPYDVMGGLGNMLTAGPRGFFSANPADQPMGADLIEKGTDAFGQAFNPNYVNTQDNVNPILKGGLGFGLDVGLDPLTYIPGGIAVAGLRGGIAGVKGAKALTEAGKLAQGAGKVAAFSKGIIEGAPGVSKLGGISKAIKPVGIKQWQDLRSYEKATKAASKAVVPVDALLAMHAGESATTVAKKIKAGEFGDVVSKKGEILKPTTAVPKLKEVFSQTQRHLDGVNNIDAIKAGAHAEAQAAKAAVLLDKLAQEAPLPKDPTAAESVGKAAEAAQKTVPVEATTATMTPSLTDLLGNLAPHADKISKQLAKTEPKVIKTEGVKPAPLGKREFTVQAKAADPAATAADIKIAHERYIKDFQASPTGIDLNGNVLPAPAKAEKWVKPSEALQHIFSQPTTGEAFTNAVGPKAVSYLSTLAKSGQEDNIRTASRFMRDVISGKQPIDKITEWATTPEHQMAQRIFEHYQVDIPGTNIRRLTGDTMMDNPATLDDAMAAAQGKTLVDEPWRAGMTQDQVDAAIKIFGEDTPKIMELTGFNWTTKQKNVARNSDIAGKGLAKYTDEINSAWQTTYLARAISHFAKPIDALNKEARLEKRWADVIAGGKRAKSLYEDALNTFSLVMHFIDTKGGSAWLGFGDRKVRLYLDQAVMALREAGYAERDTRYLMNMMVLNADTMIPLSNIAEALVEKQLPSGRSISSILRQEAGKGENAAKNFLTDPKMDGIYGHVPGEKKPIDIPSFMTPIENFNEKTGRIKGWYLKADPAKFEQAVIKLLDNSTADIAKIIGDNEGMAIARRIADEAKLTPTVRTTIQKAAESGPGTAAGIRAIANIGEEAGRVGKLQKVTPEAQAISTKNLVDSIPPQAIHEAQAIVKQKKTVDRVNNPKLKAADQAAKDAEVSTKNSVEDSAYHARMGEQLVNTAKRQEDGFDAAGNIVDAIAHDLAVKNTGMQMGIASKLDNFFNISRGVEDVIQPYKRTEIALTSGIARYEQGLESVMKKHAGFVSKGSTTTKVEQAFRDMAMGKPAVEGDQVRKDLEPFVNRVFGVAGAEGETSLWAMGHASIDDFAAYVQRAGLEFPFEMDMVKKWADEQGGISMLEAAMQKWGSWAKDIPDPMDFLTKLHYGAGLMIADKQAANLFQKIEGATSKVAAEGFKKLPDNMSPFQHPFLSHMPKGTYMSEELIQQVMKVEKLAMEAKGFKGDFGKFINEVYTPIIGNWKFGVTVLRLGHHIRNFFSDSSIQMFEEGLKNFTRSHVEAQRGLYLMNNYEGLDWAKQLSTAGDLEMPTMGKHFTDSKWGELTHGTMVEAYMKHGGPVVYHQSQDVIGDVKTPGLIQKLTNAMAFRGTKIAKKAGDLSEFQNNTNRMAHFYQFVLNNKDKGIYKTWEDLVTAGMEKVRRSHPDASMLATGERKLRLLFPFYTWFRLAAPVIAEGILARPGRFMAIPKASYNTAVAMGIDPVSLADPFPTDQLFPSFLREGMTGPLVQINHNYYATTLGIPYLDMVNQFIANPGKGIAGMISPVIKIPIELATQQQLGSGAKIKDLSDYVDSNIPGLNYVANITGTSVTGTPVSLLSGKGIDPQYAVTAGNKTPFDQFITATNWVTGLGLQNMSKQSYINAAEIEKRNAAAAAQSTRSPY
jgi:hypothetical protein